MFEQRNVEELNKKIIEEQDSLVYFGYASFEECLFFDEIDKESNLSYNQVCKHIDEHPEIIPKLSMSNLLVLLASGQKVNVDKVKECIMQKYRQGEHVFGGEKIELSSFGIISDTWSIAFGRLAPEDINEIKSRIITDLKKLKETDPKTFEIIDKTRTFDLIDNFMSSYEKGIWNEEKLGVLQELSEENPNILQSINYGIFQDDIFEMGKEFITHIARYPNFSTKLINVERNNPALFESMKQRFTKLETDSRTPEAYEVENMLLYFCAKNCFNLQKESYTEQDIDDFINFAYREKEIASNKIDVGYGENYEEKYEEACDLAFEKSTKIDDMKNAFTSKFFGMTGNTAKKFQKRYMENTEKIIIEDENLKAFLQSLEEVLNITDVEELKIKYYQMNNKFTPLQKVYFEDKLKEIYTKTYTESLKETDEKLQEVDSEIIEYNGKKIKQIKLSGKFNLLVHSTDTGFKGDKKLVEESFAKTWKEIPDASNHLISSCYINEDFLGCTPVNENGVMYAFQDIEDEKLNMVGPTDINSHVRNFNYDSANGYYMTAQDLPYSSRKVYNEVPIERRKTSPDYVVLWSDSPQEVVENSYKAASEFDIPVIYMDKRELAKQQLKQLDGLMQEFKDTKDLGVLQKLISTYETNIAGWLLNRDKSVKDDTLTQNINNEFLRPYFEERENGIYSMLDSYIEETENQSDKEKLAEIMKQEIAKYELVDLEKTPISKTKMKFDAKGILEKLELKEAKLEAPADEDYTISLKDIAEDAVKEGLDRPDMRKTEMKLQSQEIKKSEEEKSE